MSARIKLAELYVAAAAVLLLQFCNEGGATPGHGGCLEDLFDDACGARHNLWEEHGACHTSRVTRHESQVTRHTSRVTHYL